MIYALAIIRTILFFMTMMIASPLMSQTFFDAQGMGQLAKFLYAGIFIATPLYLAFDGFATYITKTKRAITFCYPILIALVVALFFAYSAARMGV